MGCTERRASIGFPMLLSIAAFLFVGATLGALGVRSFQASQAVSCDQCAMDDHNCYSSCTPSGGSYGGKTCEQMKAECPSMCPTNDAGCLSGCSSMTCPTTGGGTTGGAAPPPPPPPPPPAPKKPEEQVFSEKLSEYLALLRTQNVLPCAHELSRDTQWAEEHPILASHLYKEWEEKVFVPYQVTDKSTLSLCPALWELQKAAGIRRSGDCDDVVNDCLERTKLTYEQDGEKAWEERMETCMENHPQGVGVDFESCPFDVEDLDLVKGHGEKVTTCAKNDDCRPGTYCDKSEDKKVAMPRVRGFAANLLGQESFYGTCTELPDRACVDADRDCRSGEGCVYLQPMVVCDPAIPSTCLGAPYGFCQARMELHDAAGEEVVDLRPITRDDVIEDLGDVMPRDVEEEYQKRVEEFVEEKAEELDIGVTEENMKEMIENYEKGIMPGEEVTYDDAAIVPGNLSDIAGQAVGLLVMISQERQLLSPEAAGTVEQAAIFYSQLLLKVVTDEGGLEVEDVLQAAEWLRRVKDLVPEEVLREIVSDEGHREERWSKASVGMQRIVADVTEMLRWIGRTLDELDTEGMDVMRWKRDFEEANEKFFEKGGIRDQIYALLEEGSFEDAERIGHLIEGLFAKLGEGPESMRAAMEPCMNMMFGNASSGNEGEDCEKIQRAMIRVGPPPRMAMEGPEGRSDMGGPGGEHMSCDDRCSTGLGRVFDATDSMEQAQECLALEEEEGVSPICEDLIDGLDLQNAQRMMGEHGVQLVRNYHACVASCEEREGGGGDDWRQEEARMRDECGRVVDEAGRTCCRMEGTEQVSASCVRQRLLEWGAHMCPLIPGKVLGVDTECPEDTGYDTHNCEQYWRDAERKCKVNYQMDTACFKAAVSAFPDEGCKPGPNDPFWTMEDQWQDHDQSRMSGGCRFDEVNVQQFGDAIGKVYDVYCAYGSSTCTGRDDRGASMTFEQQQGQKWSTSVCDGGGGGGGGMGGGCTLRDIALTGDRGSVNSAVCRFDGGSGWCSVPMQNGPRADGLVVDPFQFSYADVRSHGGCDCNADGVFTMHECPAPGWTGPGGGGGTGESGCFWTDATVNGQHSYTVHTNLDGSDPRVGDRNGRQIDVTSENLNRGTQKNCYVPGMGGGAGGGGSARMCYNARNGIIECETAWDGSVSQTSCFQPNVGDSMWRPLSEYQDVQSQPVPCPGMGGTGGGGTGGSGGGSCTRATVTLRSGEIVNDVNCWNWACTGKRSGATQTFSFNVSDLTDPASCSGGGTSGGGTYGSSPGPDWRLTEWQKSGGVERTWVGPQVTDAEIAAAKAAIAQNCPATTWFSYPNPTNASQPGAGVPVCPTEGTMGGGGGAGGAATGTPAAGCSYPSGTVKSSGKAVTYASCPIETPNTCNTSEGPVPYSDLSVPAPSACASGSTSTTPSTTCAVWSFPWLIKHDGTRIDGTSTMSMGSSTVSTPVGSVPSNDIRDWGPSTCAQSSSRGGIFHAIGSFIRRVVAGF